MGYDSLADRLEGGLTGRTVVTLPDGSIDRYFGVTDAAGDRIATRAAFVDRLAGGRIRSFQLVPESVRAGGEAVNTAAQVDAIGLPVELYGHLDHPELADLPFPAVSMGEPATVHVLDFDTDELMLSVESRAIEEWSLADLFTAADTTPADWLDDEVVVLQNWVGFPGMTEALRDLATLPLGGGPLVFDPGNIAGSPVESLRPLADAVVALGEAVPVVLTANDRELDRLADVLGVTTAGTDREVGLREEMAIEAVVRHDVDRAVAAAGDVTVVENFEARRVVRRTGAGDRFDGGLAAGLAADLPWADALALGNACATHYVENDATPTRADLLDLLDSRSV